MEKDKVYFPKKNETIDEDLARAIELLPDNTINPSNLELECWKDPDYPTRIIIYPHNPKERITGFCIPEGIEGGQGDRAFSTFKFKGFLYEFFALNPFGIYRHLVSKRLKHNYFDEYEDNNKIE